MTFYLAAQVPTLRPTALPRKIDNSLSDTELDRLLNDADLIVAATDDRNAQRRIARRSLALDIPVVLPALYGDNGGEVFIQRSSRYPCFFCWDGWRQVDERLRGVSALNNDTLGVLQLAVDLSLGVLDPRSERARLMAAPPNDPRPRQLFIQRRFAALEMAPQARRKDCPSCAVGPSPLREEATSRPVTRSRSTPPRRPVRPSSNEPIDTFDLPLPIKSLMTLLTPIIQGIGALLVGLVVGIGYLVFVPAVCIGALFIVLEVIGLFFTGHFF